MLIGFDLDGVICEYTPWIEKMLQNDSIASMYYLDKDILLDPYLFLSDDDEMVIITDRPTKFKDVTKEWLKNHNIDCDVYFIGNKETELSSRHAAVKKSSVINDLNVEIYFEDDTRVVELLREMTNAKILAVNSHGDFEKWKQK